MSVQVVTVEELKSRVGEEIGVTDWFEVDQARIDAFAEVTLDHQFIHVDPAAAAATPFGSTIAHGYLTLSLLPHFMSQVALLPDGMTMAMNYGSDKVRFLAPVKVGRRVRGRVKVLEVAEKRTGQVLVKNEVTVEIEGEKRPALIAETLTLFFMQ